MSPHTSEYPPKTVYGLCARGEVRHIRVLNAIRMVPSDLEAFVFSDQVDRSPFN